MSAPVISGSVLLKWNSLISIIHHPGLCAPRRFERKWHPFFRQNFRFGLLSGLRVEWQWQTVRANGSVVNHQHSVSQPHLPCHHLVLIFDSPLLTAIVSLHFTGSGCAVLDKLQNYLCQANEGSFWGTLGYALCCLCCDIWWLNQPTHHCPCFSPSLILSHLSHPHPPMSVLLIWLWLMIAGLIPLRGIIIMPWMTSVMTHNFSTKTKKKTIGLQKKLLKPCHLDYSLLDYSLMLLVTPQLINVSCIRLNLFLEMLNTE